MTENTNSKSSNMHQTVLHWFIIETCLDDDNFFCALYQLFSVFNNCIDGRILQVPSSSRTKGILLATVLSTMAICYGQLRKKLVILGILKSSRFKWYLINNQIELMFILAHKMCVLVNVFTIARTPIIWPLIIFYPS